MKILIRKYIHLIGWCIFVGYELLVVRMLTGKTSSLTDYLLHYTVFIFFFYFNSTYVLNLSSPRYQYRYFKVFCVILLELIVYVSLNYLINVVLVRLGQVVAKPITPLRFFIVSSFWRGIYLVGLSLIYWSFKRVINDKKRVLNLQRIQFDEEKTINQLKEGSLRSQIEHLKMQVNPHLLFNTLNFVYNSINKLSKDAGESIMLLSEISHYTYIVTKKMENVSLLKEIEQIQNLISLNYLRFENQIYINTQIIGDFENFSIIPLVLLTLVENMFKHGDLTMRETPGLIYIQIKSDRLEFRIENLKRCYSTSYNEDDKSGLENIITRLNLSYSNRFVLEINDSNGIYNLFLTLELTNEI